MYQRKIRQVIRDKPLIASLLVSNSLSVALFVIRIVGSGTNRYGFMFWNLFLAWLPLIFSTLLVRCLRSKSWRHWHNIVLSLLWLGFLPNSFYLITDLVHLQTTGDINILFDTVMMVSFIFNGLVFGYISLFQIHQQLLKRFSRGWTWFIVEGILLIASFALYLGRSLRWNSWDVLFNPAGLLFDVSDRFVHPISYPEAFLTTTTFFLLLVIIYVVVWQLIQTVRVQLPRS
ncbi:MAG: hypothetical protein NVS1B7_2080 [Candidatus Saccharimonadales bacterium]